MKKFKPNPRRQTEKKMGNDTSSSALPDGVRESSLMWLMLTCTNYS